MTEEACTCASFLPMWVVRMELHEDAHLDSALELRCRACECNVLVMQRAGAKLAPLPKVNRLWQLQVLPQGIAVCFQVPGGVGEAAALRDSMSVPLAEDGNSSFT